MMAEQIMEVGTAESSHPDQQIGGRKRHWEGHQSFEISRPSPPPPVTHLLQQGHTSQSFPNSSTNRSPSIQTDELKGSILTQTTTHPLSKPFLNCPIHIATPLSSMLIVHALIDTASMFFPGCSHYCRLAAA